MAMHTETAPRFPAWLLASSVVVGIVLGLWQVGVFEHSANGRRDAGADAAAGQAHDLAGTASAAVTAGEPESPIDQAHGRAAERLTSDLAGRASDPDPDVREESSALQDALAAEQASH